MEQAAAGLLAVGLKKGDRLGIWGPNIYEWVLMQFATAKAGIILVGVFPSILYVFYFTTTGLTCFNYFFFKGVSKPCLSVTGGRICTQKGKLMIIHA